VLVRRFLKTAIWPVIDIHAKQAIEDHSFTKNIRKLSEGHFAPQHRLALDLQLKQRAQIAAIWR